MKLFYVGLLSVASAFSWSVSQGAETMGNPADTLLQAAPNRRHNTIWIIGADPQSDTARVLKERARSLYASTGGETAGVPTFLISDRANRAVFGIGGFVSLRTRYDWDNVIDNRDFIPYDIPMSPTPSDRQQFRMDVSATRLFFRTIVQSRPLGPIETYIETDFRGGNNVLRLRQAYVSFKGLTFGQTITTLADQESIPRTIDVQGPNAYTYRRNLMIRYHRQFSPHWEAAIAVEMPDASATVLSAETAYTLPQRVPDIPLYVQYNWNDGRSHLRASGLLRTMHYYDDIARQTLTELGWAAMLSGRIAVGPRIDLFGQIVYGRGIGNYLQDLDGNGYDLVSDPDRPGRLQTLPMMGWLAGFQYAFAPKWQLNAVYSQVSVWDRNDYFAQAPDTYRLSQYVAGNLIYQISPAFQVGAEYLYGMRKNADHSIGFAHRAQLLIQFNF
ncbi:MAG: porin [Rikenella sp.]|nr:porin [Rikenella sp.]